MDMNDYIRTKMDNHINTQAKHYCESVLWAREMIVFHAISGDMEAVERFAGYLKDDMQRVVHFADLVIERSSEQ